MKIATKGLAGAVFAIAIAVAMPAWATLDLTLGGTGSLTAYDIFTTSDNQATGSGSIQSFVRIGANTDIVQGYNTDARPLQFNENNSPTFTHALLLSAIPVVNISGTDYREFLLDINQLDNDSLFSLNELQIFVGNTGSPTGATVGAGGTLSFGAQASLIYDMDLAGDERIDLDYGLNSGSGSGDLFVYIKDSLFTGGTFVTLYSKFGDPHNNNDGFEEWAVRTVNGGGQNAVPEPATLAIWSLGLAGVGLVGRRRRKLLAK